MDDKLIRFFNKINFDEVDDFEGVKVSKVVINKQKESWIVYLQSDKVVNPEAMIKLINKAKNGIENVNTIDIKTDYSNILDEDIIKYFTSLSSKLKSLNRDNIDDEINAILDDILELIHSTLYKLKELA